VPDLLAALERRDVVLARVSGVPEAPQEGIVVVGDPAVLEPVAVAIGVRGWPVPGQDVALRVAAGRRDVRHVGEELERGDGFGADRDDVTEHPPTLDATASPVRHHRLEGDPVAVHVRQHAQVHRDSLAAHSAGSVGPRVDEGSQG
jgi:hypothetical protein